MANAIDSLNFNSTDYVFTLPYGTCSTAAATAAKVVALDNFSLETGASVRIKFTYANSVSSPTLNINGTGAKSIYWHGATLASSQYWQAGAVLDFVYNGTQWDMIGVAKDNNTTYSAADTSLGLVKSGGDVTISSGTITVNDDSHNHVIENVDGLQDALDGKVDLTSSQTITGLKDFTNYLTIDSSVSLEAGYYDGVPQLEFWGANGDEYTRLGNVAEPKHSSDAATKEYVDTEISELYGGKIGKAGSGTNSEIFNDYTNNTAAGDYSHAEGYKITASGKYSHAEGFGTKAINDDNFGSHAEGYGTTASGGASHAEGYYTTASGDVSHAEGYYTTASGHYSHAEGYETKTTDDSTVTPSTTPSGTSPGFYTHAEGYGTVAYGSCSHAEGDGCLAFGKGSHAEGYNTVAAAIYSHAGGAGTRAYDNQFVIGRYNSTKPGSTSTNSLNYSTFIIGNGTSTSSTSNAFRVTTSGALYASSTSITSGADYAEYFEWLDSNSNSEDRRGYFVTLDGDKIKIATSEDYILGIVSGQPSVIGNGDECWRGRYILDDFGAYIDEEYEYEEEEINEETGETKTVKKTGIKWKENPDYDSTKEYIQRSERSEWDAVGMLGVLSVRDDGTCKVNGYCKVADGGIATSADSGYRVIKRVSDNVVKVIFK